MAAPANSISFIGTMGFSILNISSSPLTATIRPKMETAKW